MIGARNCGRRNACLTDRRPSSATTRLSFLSLAPRPGARSRAVAAVTPRPARPRSLGLRLLLVGALEVATRLLDEHVVERRLHEVERLDAQPRVVERAHDRRDVRGAVAAGRPSRRRSCDGIGSPKRAMITSAASEPPSAITTSRCERPICAFSAAGVPSAAILPSSMIPTRSASWSASSRYCVVRNTVVPSSFRRRTSSQIAMRLTGSSPVVGSSRNRTLGSCTSAVARSSRRRMPPE